MSDKCEKCVVAFVPNESTAKCVECKRVYHPACTRVGSAQNFTKAKKLTWKCDSCVDESSSSVSVRSNEEGDDRKSIIEVLKTMKADIIKNTDERIDKVLNTMKNEFSTLNISVQALQTSHQELEARCSTLEEANREMRDEVLALRQQLQDSEQHSRSANIEIVGLPLTAGENIYNCLHHVAAAIGVPYKREDISIAHRLRLYSKVHHHPPIIVQFVSRSVRESWLSAARKKKKFNATDVHQSLTASNMFINEHLTPHNKQLLGRARKLQRDSRIHFAGYFNGKVMLKLTEKSESVRITTLEDLDKYGG